MDRRRNIPARPTSNEELDCWTLAAKSLNKLSTIYANTTSADTIGRVNRAITSWPNDDTLPAQGIDGLKSIQTKLTTALSDIITSSEQEVKAIAEVIENVEVLMALRKAPEAPSAEKRNKRPRAPSPGAPTLPANPRSVSITVPPRTNSIGPTGLSRDARNRKDSATKPLPLQVGRKVVFKPPTSAQQEESNWIMAIVRRYLSSDKHGPKYEVQDAEPQDDGQPGPIYIANGKMLLPLPDPDASLSSPGHLSHYPEFPVGATVMALYPDTSCFYRAEVIATRTVDRSSANKTPMYKVKFEDDEDMEHGISAHFVVEFPARLL